jgi:hypothetical protein
MSDLSPSMLRIETAALCEELASASADFEAQRLSFEELNRRYDLLRPRALRLAESMMRYVPDGDARLWELASFQGQRFYKTDRSILKDSLPETAASARLISIQDELRNLTAYLPETEV